MKSGHDFDAAKVLKLSADAGDAFACFQKIAHRGVAHDDDHLRLNGGDFAKKKRPADRSFLERRLTIARWPTAIDVANQHFFAFQPDGFDYLREKLTGAADKWFSLSVFISTRSFADKHQTRFMIAMRVDHLRAPFAQAAARAVTNIVPDVFERLAGPGQRGRGRCEIAEQRSWGRGWLACNYAAAPCLFGPRFYTSLSRTV